MILTLFSIFVYADSNGIWYDAKDVRGGTFGLDEQAISNYTFINPVIFNGFVFLNNNTFYKGKDLDSRYPVLDINNKVKIENLPFKKGDVIPPSQRSLFSSLPSYNKSYFDISQLQVSGNIATNVCHEASFGPGNGISGSEECVKPSKIYYVLKGANSPSSSNYCEKVQVNIDKTLTYLSESIAGKCNKFNVCGLTATPVVSNYPDTTQCGGSASYKCQSGVCYTYTWQANGWGSCSGGTQTRTFYCQRNDGTTVSSSYCSGISNPLPTSKSCNTKICIYNQRYSPGSGWYQSGWQCSEGGAQTSMLSLGDDTGWKNQGLKISKLWFK